MADDAPPRFNEALMSALDGPGIPYMAGAVSAFTHHKMNFIEHVPTQYYMPGAPAGALERLYKELADKGTIKMHRTAWIPECLVLEGIEPLPVKPEEGT